MEIFLAALVIFVLAMLGMAIGVIFGKPCIRGSCGGLSALRDRSGRSYCEHCPSRESEDPGSAPEQTDCAAETEEQQRSGQAPL